MANVAFLVDAADGDVELGSVVADRLASLGVTNLALYRDGDTLCLVLEGWAFDPSSSAAAASAIGLEPETRTLRPVMQSALRAQR